MSDVAQYGRAFEALADRCRYVCPQCTEYVWMQVQCGEMWCPRSTCRFYANQVELLGLLYDPTLADVRVDMAELAERLA